MYQRINLSTYLGCIDRLVSNEVKVRIETLLSDEEFLELIEVKHGKSNGLKRAVNLSTRSDTEPCLKQEVSHILEVGKIGTRELRKNHATRRARNQARK